MTEAPSEQPTIRLDSFLKVFGLAETGGRAKAMIQDGMVSVNEKVETRRRHMLTAGDTLQIEGLGKHRVTLNDSGEIDAEVV
ncbi:MAG: hypothetical protein Aurels2KO_01800 [Aureliella sp.]